MLRFTALVALAAALIPSFALAEEVPSATAYTVNLKDYYTAVVFYVDSPDGFQIVTSVAAENGPAIRFTNHLLADQSATLEGSGEVGARSSGLVLSRIGDVLHVMPLPETEATAATQTPATDHAVIPATLPVTAAAPAQR
jgi:hypothetical protein